MKCVSMVMTYSVCVYSKETKERNGNSQAAVRTNPQDAQDDPLSGSTSHVST